MRKQLLLKQAKQSNVFKTGFLKSRPVFAGLLFGFLTPLLVMTGCLKAPAEINVNLGKEFSVAINQTAVVSNENLKIKLLEVNDSRCPTGAQCIWAGEAKAFIEVNDGEINNLTLVEPGTSGNNSYIYKNYTFAFKVTPYPMVNKPIANKDYRLMLTVEKAEEAPAE